MALGKLPDDEETGAIFAEINITPLTDIFLVMLIIFMVSSSVAVERATQAVERAATAQRSGLKVNLPEGAAKEIDPGSNSLVVGIMADGEIVVNGQKVAEPDLQNLFRSAFAKDKATQVVIKADAGVHHGRVVGVMELAKEVGLSHLAIATKGGS
jgi:biopolymer transport protein ExbD